MGDARYGTACGTGLEPRGSACGAEPEPFDMPPRVMRRRDWAATVALGIGLAVALGVVLGSVNEPAVGTTLSHRTLIQWFAEMVAVLLATGAIGSAILFPQRRWREVLVGPLVVGGLAAGFAFDVWSNANSGPPDCTSAQHCDDANAVDSMFAAVPSALIVLTGAAAGRLLRRVALARR